MSVCNWSWSSGTQLEISAVAVDKCVCEWRQGGVEKTVRTDFISFRVSGGLKYGARGDARWIICCFNGYFGYILEL
jgi:hypothetical protein